MASEARLNVDVLEVVSKFLTEVPDVLSFALTSIPVHQIAIRRLLSMRPIFFSRGAESMYKFHSFLFANAPARTPYVRALDIESGPSHSDLSPGEPDSTPFLIEILTSCPNLRSVTIVLVDDDSNGLLCDLNIARTIAALPNLRSLTLFCSNMCRQVLLRELCAPLRELSLWGYTKECNSYHPAALETFLPRLAPNLEKLEIGGFIVDPQEMLACGIAPTSVFTLTQYPIVRSLFIVLQGAPLLDYLQYLFPALDGTLTFRSPQLPDISPPEIHAATRAVNQRAQESSHSRPWSKLDCIVCDPLTLYLLGLRCPVRHVVIDAMDVPLEPYAVVALRENPVPRLNLTIRQESSLENLFTPSLARTLTHLTLLLVYDFRTLMYPENPTDTPGPPLWGDVLDGVVSSLRPLQSLTHLRVFIRANASCCNVNWNDDDVMPIVARAKAYVGRFREAVFDFNATATELARSLPSLEYLFVETYGSLASYDDDVPRWYDLESWHAARGWRVEEHGAGEHEPSLVGLHADVAETIIRREDLAFNEANEGDEDF